MHRRLHRADPAVPAQLIGAAAVAVGAAGEQGRVPGRRAALRGQLEDHREGLPQPTAGEGWQVE